MAVTPTQQARRRFETPEGPIGDENAEIWEAIGCLAQLVAGSRNIRRLEMVVGDGNMSSAGGTLGSAVGRRLVELVMAHQPERETR